MKDIVLSPISLKELEDALARIVEEKINFALQENSNKEKTTDDSYITRKEVSQKLRISLPTLNTLTKSGVLQSYRIGKRVLYRPKEVQEALTSIVTTKYRRKEVK